MVSVGVNSSKPIFPSVPLFTALESALGVVGFVGLKFQSLS